jgi:hypothetical protein
MLVERQESVKKDRLSNLIVQGEKRRHQLEQLSICATKANSASSKYTNIFVCVKRKKKALAQKDSVLMMVKSTGIQRRLYACGD